jgi:hypothetical protein
MLYSISQQFMLFVHQIFQTFDPEVSIKEQLIGLTSTLVSQLASAFSVTCSRVQALCLFCLTFTYCSIDAITKASFLLLFGAS